MQTICTTAVLAIFCTSSGIAAPGNSKSKAQHGLPTENECGISASAAKGGRIVGGEEAVPHSWPWQAYIYCVNPSYNNYHGGSIISDKWIMTAAHVLRSTLFDIRRDCRVYLGKHDIRQQEPTQVEGEIDKYFVHEKFNLSNLYLGFDLGLIKLKKSVKFTNAIKPICLPFGRPDLPVNTTCYVTGWGRTVYNVSKVPDVLKQLAMTVQEDLYCRNFTRFALGRVICAGRWNSNEDACKGDSGGPLSCQEHDREWYQRGIIAGGPIKCNSVSSFTKVTAFQEWIVNIITHN